MTIEKPTPKRSVPIWRPLILASLGLPLSIPMLWIVASFTAAPLHPNPKSIPAVTRFEPSPEWAGAVEQGRRVARASVAGQNLPGLSVAVGLDGDIVWAEGFGFADLKHGVPVTPDHRFRLGTASEALTSAAAGLLLEDGRLNLDEEVQTYAAAFPRNEQPVTLRELMGHTAGVAPAEGDGPPLFTLHCERPAEVLQRFAGGWLPLAGPGAQFRFSIYDWILVSAAIETAADQPFLTFMRERIFDPLGMRDTLADSGTIEPGEDFPLFNLIRELIYDPEARPGATSHAAKPPPQDGVTHYFPRFRSDPNYGMHVMRALDHSCYAGAGVFLSTPSDLVRFGMAIHSGALLEPATVETLQTSQVLSSGEETGYGLGWDLETVTLAGKTTLAIGHNGDTLGGMVATLMTFPEYGIVVAATSNISHADTFSIAVQIAQAFAAPPGEN